MEKRMVQLWEDEYLQLHEKAKLKDDEIRSLAEEYYQERGVFQIYLNMRIEKFYSDERNFKTFIFSTENGLRKRDPLSPLLTEGDKKELERDVSELCRATFISFYGNIFKDRAKLDDSIETFALIKWILYGIAFSGWGVAAAIMWLK